jgi:hypothetical protein
MRWLFSFLLLALLGIAGAKSIAGPRLLVVLEEAAEKENYSVFLGDLEGKLLRSSKTNEITSFETCFSVQLLFICKLYNLRLNPGIANLASIASTITAP